MLAPICLFTYNRLEETKNTINSLSKNYLASQSDLIIFSDGPKNEKAFNEVNKVRKHIKNVSGFKSIRIINSQKNKGLASSIITGVDNVIKEYGKVIVLEDDLITSTNFLNFMNQALDYYIENEKVFSISGFGHKIKLPDDYPFDVFVRERNYSWGWATWQNRWKTIDWNIQDWNSFKKNRKLIKKFNSQGSDLFKLLRHSMEGKNNSWAIRFGYNQFKQKKYTIGPCISKVMNEGYGESATHCKTNYNRHKIKFDKTDKVLFTFIDDVALNTNINKQLLSYNSIASRVKSKIFSALIQYGLIKRRNSIEYIKNTI